MSSAIQDTLASTVATGNTSSSVVRSNTGVTSLIDTKLQNIRDLVYRPDQSWVSDQFTVKTVQEAIENYSVKLVRISASIAGADHSFEQEWTSAQILADKVGGKICILGASGIEVIVPKVVTESDQIQPFIDATMRLWAY